MFIIVAARRIFIITTGGDVYRRCLEIQSFARDFDSDIIIPFREILIAVRSRVLIFWVLAIRVASQYRITEVDGLDEYLASGHSQLDPTIRST